MIFSVTTFQQEEASALLNRARILARILEEFQQRWVNSSIQVNRDDGHIKPFEAARIGADLVQRLASKRFRVVRPVSISLSVVDNTLNIYCADPWSNACSAVEIVDLDTGLFYEWRMA